MEYKSKKKTKDKIKDKIKNKTIDKNLQLNSKHKLIISNSNNSSINKSLSRKYSSKKKKSEKSKIRDESTKREKKNQINNDLIKKQYKIIKDFLTPILKEENARQLVSCYTKKLAKPKNRLLYRNKNASLNKRAILDYSFLKEKPNNRIRIPLFQIFFPKKYKKHIEKNQTKNNIEIKRPCHHLSTPNFEIKDNPKFKKLSKINNINNIALKQNNSEKNKNNQKNQINNKKVNNIINRPKTPPLYLRIDEVQKRHNEEIEKLKKKYEYEYNINNNYSNFSVSENESKTKSRNISHSAYDFEKWYNYEKTWQKIKNVKINIIKSEIEENKEFMNKNDKNEETFKPKINKNSVNLANKKYDNDFYLRLKDYQNNKNIKMKILQKKLEPKFKPYINNNYKIKSEYYDYMKYDQKLINRDFNFFHDNL